MNYLHINLLNVKKEVCTRDNCLTWSCAPISPQKKSTEFVFELNMKRMGRVLGRSPSHQIAVITAQAHARLTHECDVLVLDVAICFGYCNNHNDSSYITGCHNEHHISHIILSCKLPQRRSHDELYHHCVSYITICYGEYQWA